jgi:uncharacterized protein involved in exopolysaccharide biosynthesis
MMPINHLRNRIDNLSWRIEQSRDSDDLRKLALECSELERAIQQHESDLQREVADMEAAKQTLRRLKTRL